MQDFKACISNVSFRVLQGPYYSINDKFLMSWRDVKESWKAM